MAYALEEIILRPYQLTGYLDIDVKNVPINSAGRYRIPGIQCRIRRRKQNLQEQLTKLFAAIFNPADFLHNLLGKKGVQMQKLKENEGK